MLIGAALLFSLLEHGARAENEADVPPALPPAGAGSGTAEAAVDPGGFRLRVSLLETAPPRGDEDAGPGFSLFSANLDVPAAQALPAAPPWGLPGQPESMWPQPKEPLSNLRNWDQPASRKFLRGTILITGTELLSGVILTLLPQSFTKWDDDYYKKAGQHLKRAWTEPPVWDNDVFFHNWIGHPYVGAFYYNMMRSQGATQWQSFGFALFQSTLWEYVLEAVAEQPSIQDVILTPVAGSLVGELFHRWSLSILRGGPPSFLERVLVFFLNPAYVINNGYRAPE